MAMSCDCTVNNSGDVISACGAHHAWLRTVTTATAFRAGESQSATEQKGDEIARIRACLTQISTLDTKDITSGHRAKSLALEALNVTPQPKSTS